MANYVSFLSLACSIVLFTVCHGAFECPEFCICVPAQPVVQCDINRYDRIPPDIPENTEHLHINKIHFITGTLQQRNFTKLLSLEMLYLTDCGIETIEPGTFSNLQHLTRLDLSKNRIKALGSNVFQGLNLDHLFLSNNPHMRLSPDVFVGLSVQGLHLSGCYFHSLDPQIFNPLNQSLKMLRLESNRFKTFQKSYSKLFSQLKHVWISNNPLHCNCELTWLRDLFETNTRIFNERPVPRCSSPPLLSGRSFQLLEAKDMLCKKPVVQDMEVTVDDENITLRCMAEADPAPSMYWSSNNRKTISNPLFGGSISQTEITFPRSSQLARKTHSCTATNAAGNSSVLLKFNWPKKLKQTRPTTVTTSTTFTTTPTTCPPVPTVSEQQCSDETLFTLFELIGAAAGAFVLALVLSGICLWCVYRRLTSRHRYSASLDSGKENLYSAVSQEERERFTVEEKERLYAASQVRAYAPGTMSYRMNPLDLHQAPVHTQHILHQPSTYPHAYLPESNETPVYGHAHLVRIPQPPIAPHSVAS